LIAAPTGESARTEPARAGDAAGLDVWDDWRARVAARLSDEEPSEETLREVLKARPPAPEKSPAAALRHDQATADVLLGSNGVRAVLKRLGGIDDHFLGTGLSNPVENSDYCKASVHEYLIPNLHDDDPNVWMIRLKPFTLEMTKTIKELLQEDRKDREETRRLKQAITSLCETKRPGDAVVRFAWLEEEW
jgi:hypothetical protein